MATSDDQTPETNELLVGGGLAVHGYEQFEEIGRGGFAVVYRAWQPAFKRHVAIKVLSSILDEGALQRFERECLAIGALSGHPNIVTVHELGRTEERRPYIAMECLEGGSAGDRLLREGPLHWSEVVEVGVKLAGALESAHRAGVLHRDVKPENVLFSRFGDAKLADFGIARIQGRTETQSGQVMASVAHAAPEILSNRRPSVSSDLYSLASTLYALLAGSAPFVHPDDETIVPILARIAASPVPNLRPRGVPEPLCAVIEQALAKDPSERGPDALSLGRHLQRIQDQAGLPVTRLPLEGEPVARSERDVRTTVQLTSADPPKLNAVDDEPTHSNADKAASKPGAGRGFMRFAAVALLALVVIGGVWLGLTRASDPGNSRLGTASSVSAPPTSEASPPANGKSVSPPATSEVVFRDDFSSPSSGWTEVNDEHSNIAYEQGQYRFGVEASVGLTSDSTLEGLAFREDLTKLGDVSIESDATLESGDGLFGLVCRQQDTSAHHYSGVVDGGGSWGLFEKEDETRPLSRGEISVGEEAVGKTRLRLDCIGGENGTPVTLRLFRDGRPLGEAEDGSPLPPGSVGLTVRSSSEPTQVLFDNFVVRRAGAAGS